MKIFRFEDNWYRYTNTIFNEISFTNNPIFSYNGNPEEVKKIPKWVKSLTIKKITTKGKNAKIGCEKIYLYKGKIFLIPFSWSRSAFYVNTESIKKLAKYYKAKTETFFFIVENINKFPKKWQRIIKQVEKEIKKC